MPPIKIFLSSTFKDLESYRAEVIARLRKLDDVVVRCMEDFGARTDAPKDFCVREAAECDLFVGVVGHLYGYVPPGDERSITEQEYGAARDAGRDRLLFVAPDTFAVPIKLVRADSHLEKQERFREEVLSDHVVDLDWSTPKELASGVMAAVYNWIRNRSSAAAPAAGGGGVAGIDLVAYSRRCRQRWDVVDLTTLAAPGALDADVSPPKLSQVFIPQDCRRSRPAVSLPRDYLEEQGIDAVREERLLDELRAAWSREERVPSLEMVARPDAAKLVLLGDPGAGKSSLARYVLLRLLDPWGAGEDEQEAWVRSLAGHWPVLVELRDLIAREAEGKCTDLVGYLAHVGEAHGFGYDRAALEEQLCGHPTLLIVDGLDEVFSVGRRRGVVEEIIGLENRFPQLRVLVSSRIAGFDAQPFESAGFSIATLDDLSEEQIELFADRWFALVFPGEFAKADQARTDLLDTIRRRPALRAIAGNPLILTIMAVIARHKRLARSRAQIYAQALEVLCYAWDYRRGLALDPDSPLADLQPDDTLMILRAIAWHMQESKAGLRANAIGTADLRAILVGFFESRWRFPPPRANRAAAEMIRLLQERNWVLTLRGPDLYGFVHRTFLEYLCALELTKRFEAQEISVDTLRISYVLRWVGDDSYSEVIRLLCGQLPVRAADRLIETICLSEIDERIWNRLLLAWQSLSELDPRQLAEAERARAAALSRLYQELELDPASMMPNLRFINELMDLLNSIEPGSWPMTPAPLPSADFTLQGSWELKSSFITLLARGIWLPDPASRRHLQSMLDSQVWHQRILAIHALSAFNEEKVSTQLVERGLSDLDERVRLRTLWLPFFYLVRPPLRWLHKLAVEDVNSRVRSRSLHVLISRGSSEDVHFATNRAIADPDARVRADTLASLSTRRMFVGNEFFLMFFDDKEAIVRKQAMFCWCRGQEDRLIRRLLTKRLDGKIPGIDPHEPIEPERVKSAAAKLEADAAMIRAAYEQLLYEHKLPLRLAWLE